MAFLDNSGDIILDAVLTDTGRMRLAKGDGSFNITKFALSDDEIDYANFVANTGSAYADLQILQTPVLEAFTNNGSSMKSKLISISDNNLLFLPIIKLNEIFSGDVDRHGNDQYTVAVNTTTEDKFSTTHKVMSGENPADNPRYIRIDQGLDTTSFSPSRTLASALNETQYIIEIDNRLGTIIGKSTSTSAPLSYIDDDNIASYFVSTSNAEFVYDNPITNVDSTTQAIAGPRGTVLEFKLGSSLDLADGAYFDDLGATVSMTDDGGTSTYKYIDTFVRIQGATTGYRLDIPVRFVRFHTE
jgi:hypothetical protein|tara:strand:+ start:7312 stop:8214 length:903 start_codon:yes stop_codon:yes gene_type:complete